MKKNNTLKIVLAMLFVVLVSLVSFVGVYKGKNLLREYSLGKEFSDKKVAIYSVVENTTDETEEEATEETEEQTSDETATEETEEQTTEETATEGSEEQTTNETTTDETEEQKTEETQQNETVDIAKQYNDSKNIIEKRLASMHAEDYDIRLNEETGSLVIEVPSNMDSNYLSEVVAKGKVEIVNQSTSETIIDYSGFKSASTTVDSTNYTIPVVTLKIEFTNNAKNIFKNINTNYTDSEGNESEATFALTLDEETLYSDSASTFANTAKNGSLDLVLGQEEDSSQLEEYSQSASTLVALINNGEIPVEYQLDSIQIVKSNIKINTIIIVAVIIGLVMLAYAIIKFKKKGILPVLSLIGLVATILLVLRYTNVKITLFTILGLAVIVISNYILILKSLGNDKTFKQNFIELLNILIPCFIIAVVFCCSPYIGLATMGMTIFWGLIVMCIYNLVITKILIDK